MDDVMERLRNALKDTGLTDDDIDALDEDEDEGAMYFVSRYSLTQPRQRTLH